MSAVPFDTLKLADKRAAGGLTPEQARTAASAMADTTIGADFATKSDLHLTADALKRDMAALELRLMNKIGGMMIFAVGIMLAAFRYLPAPHP
jgi:hypothetical protein